MDEVDARFARNVDASPSPRPGPVRILVIDDNEDIHADFHKVFARGDRREVELDALESELFGKRAPTSEPSDFDNVEIDTALQGDVGVELVRGALGEGRPYDIIFLDVRMPPGMDGIATAKLLWGLDPELKIALCTAYSDYSWSEIRQQLPKEDQLLILRKPFSVTQVRDLVRLRWG